MNDKVNIFGIQFDALKMEEVVNIILKWTRSDEVRGRYIVTPNVDHVVELQHNKAFQKAYKEASLVIADGKPLVLIARLLKNPLPETLPGSDLLLALFDAANTQNGLNVYLLGAAPGVGNRAADNITSRWPAIRVVGTYSPPLEFELDEAENLKIIQQIKEKTPEVLVIGLGAPKQEIWINQYADKVNAKVVLCLGATIDFLGDEKKRAPLWMRRIGLEWLYRCLTEPKRLLKRYVRDAWIFPQIVWRELF